MIEVAESEETKPDAKPTTSNLQDAFNDVLDNAVLKLWDERSRNKTKGKRKRLSKDEEKTLSTCNTGVLVTVVNLFSQFLNRLSAENAFPVFHSLSFLAGK